MIRSNVLNLVLPAVVLLFAVGNVFGQSTKKTDSKNAAKLPLKVGDVAPDWELPGSDGKTYKLSSFKGKQAVIVSWYPMALTGG